MKHFLRSLPLRNILRRPGRTAALSLLSAFLSLSVFAGTLVTASLRRGLSSLEARLGADIMVVPYEATTKTKLEDTILQGLPGYFYMDSGILEKVAAREGIARMSPQFFLASTKSGCCSIPVQLIGYDPDTDFTVTPWIRQSGGSAPGDGEILVGNDLNAFPGDELMFYGKVVRVSGKLDRTGTNLDTAVYMNVNTIRALIQSSLDLGKNIFAGTDPDRVISCILIRVADGHSVEEVANDLNLHVKKIRAVQTKSMISGVADALSGVSDIASLLSGAVWVLSLIVLAAAFLLSVNERKREFAVLRVIGASRGRLAGTVIAEAALTGLLGALIGIAAGFCLILPFSRLIETQLGLPYLSPGSGEMLRIALFSLCLTVLSGALAAGAAAFRISRIDTGLILREGNG